MSILQNAIDSIALGMEDFASTDPRRLISCTRNLFAGILLLFKAKLADLSPSDSNEVLIRQQIVPKHALEDYYFLENLISTTDGGEPAIINCPECKRNTYLLGEDVCVICEVSVERKCKRCGLDIPYCEIDGSGYCSWCARQMLKDD